MIIVFVELRKGNYCNERNVATVLRAMVKSHNRLKGTKVFVCEFSGRNLKSFSKIAGKSPCWGPFIVKSQHVMTYSVRHYSVDFIEKETLPRRLLHNYFQ